MNMKRMLHWLIVTGVFAMPLLVFVVAYDTFFPFVFAKNIFFRVLTEIIFAAWLVLAFLDKEYRPRITPVTLAFTAFTAAVLLADVFGVNPMKSFFSNFERMEGFVTILHLFMFFLVAANIFRFEKIALWFWRISLGSSFFLVLNSAVQFITTEKDRLDSTLGNPIYQAVYALFHIFIALFLMTREGAARWERVAYGATIPLLAWVLYATATRGAILGTVGGLLLASFGIALTVRGNSVIRWSASIVAVVTVLAAGGFFIAKDSSFVQENSVLKRFSNISLSDGSVFARTVNWSIAWQGVKERPVFGWGQENYSVVFDKYYDARMYDQEQWFDRVHNVVLDWLIASGFVGLLAYLSIFLALLWCVYKTTKLSTTQKWLLVGLFAAYSFHNLTVFDQIISYILFAAICAWVAAMFAADKEKMLFSQALELRSSWILVSGFGISCLLAVYFVNIPAWNTNKIFIHGLQDFERAAYYAEKQGDNELANSSLEQSLEKLKKAEERKTYGIQEVHEQIAQKATALIGKEWVGGDIKQAWYEFGVESLSKEIQKAPQETRFYVFLASLHQAANNFPAEREVLQSGYETSPARQIILVDLAANAQKQGEKEKVQPLLKQAYELEPSFDEVAVLYAIRLVMDGDIDEFDRLFADSTYIGSDQRMLRSLIEAGLHDRARALWEQALIARKEKRIVFLLAAIYDQLGYRQYVGEIVERAIELDPEAQSEGEKILEILNQNS